MITGEKNMTEHTLQVDGYGVGDRLLEGVMFNVTIIETDEGDFNIQSVEIQQEYASYFSQLNAKMWYHKIQDYVEDNIKGLRKVAEMENKSLSELLHEMQDELDCPNLIDTLLEY